VDVVFVSAVSGFHLHVTFRNPSSTERGDVILPARDKELSNAANCTVSVAAFPLPSLAYHDRGIGCPSTEICETSKKELFLF